MKFYDIGVKEDKNGNFEVFPNFYIRSDDLFIRGGNFYAIWDESIGLWSTNENDVCKVVDSALLEYGDRLRKEYPDRKINVKTLLGVSSGSWYAYRRFIKNAPDNFVPLDENLTFLNTETVLEDYASKRLPYNMEVGECPAFNKLATTWYDPIELEKIMWAIGAIISGEAKSIQKFMVLYGESGSGKSSMLEIIQKLFYGYYTMFEAKALGQANNQFAMESFKGNSLVAIQHDGDLSRIEDNSTLNSIVSHDEMLINEKHKSKYVTKLICFLFMASNKPVKITDGKSGLLRRLIDTVPSGRVVPPAEYQTLMNQINFELGAIASQCLGVYKNLGKDYYSSYRSTRMSLQTDPFYNFVEEQFGHFKEEDTISLVKAYSLYKKYCEESRLEHPLPKYKFKSELMNYFKELRDYKRGEGGIQERNVYVGFRRDIFKYRSEHDQDEHAPEHSLSIILDSTESLFDSFYAHALAQYANADGTPFDKWDNITRTLAEIDTTKQHYVKVPENHIVIDFDLVDENGEKSLEKNLQEASKFPPTYAEYSRSGKGIHLHYIYDGDIDQLSALYSEKIEIKKFKGGSALRRKLTMCNNTPIAHISSGLPLKKGSNKMVNVKTVQTEQKLRDLITKNLKKEIHPSTASSVDFIYKILEEAYNSGLKYDVTDMRSKILAFAISSTNQSLTCVKLVNKMKFKSDDDPDFFDNIEDYEHDDLIFYDVEVYPNLFVVCWKKFGPQYQVVKMINPSPQEIERLFNFKLIGFYNLEYDNQIMYARHLGYTNEQLYHLSQRLVDNSAKDVGWREAKNVSYTDIYDFSTKKQSLKKWEIELGIHHQEMGLPWDEPVPEEKWLDVADYCANDVIAEERVFIELEQDWIARQILAELSGLTVNDKTNAHSAAIIFGRERNPQSEFIYTDLSETFPGYVFDPITSTSTYREEVTGEGGYVYAEPGIYGNVALLDIASMHPFSIRALNMFGPYTERYNQLVDSRIGIKHFEYDSVRPMFDGKLEKYLGSDEDAEKLAGALKIVINSVYGMTSAKFPNKFKDPRNIDNICAKRGALFMIDLKHAVQEKGFVVAHIKTDSIKIPDATPEIIEFVKEFGARYGYTFEHEATFDKFCLLNDAVYVGKYQWHLKAKKIGTWDSTGTQLIHPYVFKTLFSKEQITLKDMIETRSVKTALYLDMNENLADGEHSYRFVGKEGAFYPIKPGCGGGILLRESKDKSKMDSASGAKGYRWLEAEVVQELNKDDDIDLNYYRVLVDAAASAIEKFGDLNWFTSEIPYDKHNNGILPF